MIRLERSGACAVVTLERPAALNALNTELLGRLDDALAQIEAGDYRALIVTGAGDRAFCAGADVAELLARPVSEAYQGQRLGQRVFDRLEQLPIPSVAAINGFAVGGGLELALACTFRLAVATARLGLPEIKLGLIPGHGGTQRLPRLIGRARALEMILTGDLVTAGEAERIGLVNRVLEDDVVAAGLEFGERLARLSLPALRLARAAVLRAGEVSLSEGLEDEARLGADAYALNDSREGMSAFLEKRPARFADR